MGWPVHSLMFFFFFFSSRTALIFIVFVDLQKAFRTAWVEGTLVRLHEVVIWQMWRFWPASFGQCNLGQTVFGQPIWRGFGAAGASHDSKRVHLRVPALRTPPKFHERNCKRGRKKENCGGTGKKKRAILGPPSFRAPNPSGRHPLRPPPFGAHLFLGFGAPTLRAPPSGPPPQRLTEPGLSWIGLHMPGLSRKTRLA